MPVPELRVVLLRPERITYPTVGAKAAKLPVNRLPHPFAHVSRQAESSQAFTGRFAWDGGIRRRRQVCVFCLRRALLLNSGRNVIGRLRGEGDTVETSIGLFRAESRTIQGKDKATHATLQHSSPPAPFPR